MKNLLLLTLLICCYPVIVAANAVTFCPNKPNGCKITKSTMNDYEPEKFQLSNNLLRKTGQQPNYYGTKIVIKGKLLDQNCVPVSEAKIYLWQVANDGKYPYKPLRTKVNKAMLNLKSDSTFTGSGTATTNNKGEFYFVTIYPKNVLHELPNVNIRVEHRNLGQLQTKLHLLNAKHDAERIYRFDLVMPGEVLKRY